MLTVRELAELCGVHVRTVKRWLHEGKGPGVHVMPGGHMRFSKGDVDEWLGTLRKAS